MAVGKEIRGKISSVKSTQKITKAMEMVAASKMRRAQERMLASRPYSQKLQSIIEHVASSNTEYKHPYLLPRAEVKRVGMIVVSTDRGLCGGLNSNLFRLAMRELIKWKEQGVEVELTAIGKKATAFFRRLKVKINAQIDGLGDRPHLKDLLGTIQVPLQAYDSGAIDRLYILENHFINTMTQLPKATQLLPVQAGEDDKLGHHWDYIYEPDAKEILDSLLTRYIESLVYQAVLENIGCEMAARMVAMKSATDNAGNVIKDLQLIYNKARQAAITQELSEIVAGAAAV
jgi:F-type H+-transporting ATPase subunit gamma